MINKSIKMLIIITRTLIIHSDTNALSCKHFQWNKSTKIVLLLNYLISNRLPEMRWSSNIISESAPFNNKIKPNIFWYAYAFQNILAGVFKWISLYILNDERQACIFWPIYYSKHSYYLLYTLLITSKIQYFHYYST